MQPHSFLPQLKIRKDDLRWPHFQYPSWVKITYTVYPALSSLACSKRGALEKPWEYRRQNLAVLCRNRKCHAQEREGAMTNRPRDGLNPG